MRERKTGDTFNPKKDPIVIPLITTPKGKKRASSTPSRSRSMSPNNVQQGSPIISKGPTTPSMVNENLSSGSSPSETPLCSPSLNKSHLTTNSSKTLTIGVGPGSVSPSRVRPKLGLMRGQTSTSLDNTFDSSRTFEGNDSFDLATDNYLSDISCDITE